MRFVQLLFFLLFVVGWDKLVYSQACGTPQSLTTTQENQISSLLSQLQTALDNEDFNTIDQLNADLLTAFAIEAGKPESVETYYPLTVNNTWLNTTEAIALSRILIDQDSAVYSQLWKLAKGMNPPSYQPHSIFLRSAAETAVGLLQIAAHETDISRKNRYTTWATSALDSLMTMQLTSGAFPFPDLRTYQDPVFTPIIQHFLNNLGTDSLLALSNGWIIDDFGSGDFKFDAGVIANAYYQAYVYTGIPSYRDRCVEIGNYLLPLSMNTNYNYNSFVSLGLSRSTQLTNDPTYQNRAEINLRYGVLPGQTANGRWMDGHNANSRYHNLLIYNILPSIQSINSSTYSAELDTLIIRAVRNLTDYTESCESATGFKWLLASSQLNDVLFDAQDLARRNDLIGRYIQQAALNGKYLDVPTMGMYFELLHPVSLSLPDEYEKQIRLSPNPVSDFLLIQSESTPITGLRIIDQNGELIQQYFVANTSNPLTETIISCSTIPAGYYFLEVTTSEAILHYRLIKK